MTEQEWLACTDDPAQMLRPLRHRANDRKFHLFALAQCRRLWDRIPDQRSRHAVEVAGRYVEGVASEGELARANEAAWEAHRGRRRGETGPGHPRGGCL